MTIKEAEQFIGFNIKEGVYASEEFEGWSDEDLIAFAEREMAKGDWYANRNEED